MILCSPQCPKKLLQIQRKMKTSRGVVITCLLALVALSYESAFQELNSLNDLKKVFSEKAVPLHSLTLLHWFANHVDIINNSVVQLNFNINGDFGSQSYGNNEGLLPAAPQGYYYYTVGSINPTSANACPIYKDFPEHVLFPKVIEPANTGRNRDRIIVSVTTLDGGAQGVGQMYLTQHFKEEDNPGSRYDPQHTFKISTSLLQQIRLFGFNNNLRSLLELRNQFDDDINDNMLTDLINIWGRDKAPLGLLYLTVVPERGNLVGVCRSNRSLETDLTVKFTGDSKKCEIQHMDIEVVTGNNGTAKVLWRNVPKNKLESGVAVALFKNQMDQGKSLKFMTIQSSEGSYDTSLPLTEGLQARLHNIRCYLCSPTLMEEICRGKEVTNPQVVPVTGYANLQLFQRDGNICFRLYIKKGCDEWISHFATSWVGLYTSAEKNNQQYALYEWAKNFKQGPVSGEYNTFEHCTTTTVSSGLQARFMINEGYMDIARTPMWR